MINELSKNTDKIFEQIIGSKLSRILVNNHNLYYGNPCLIEIDRKLGLDLIIDQKYYELIIKSPIGKEYPFKLTKIWKGIFEHRVKHYNRSFDSSINFLSESTYSINRETEILQIELYKLKEEKTELENKKKEIYIRYINIYLNNGKIIEINRDDGKFIEIRISDTNNFSKSFIEEEFDILKKYENRKK